MARSYKSFFLNVLLPQGTYRMGFWKYVLNEDYKIFALLISFEEDFDEYFAIYKKKTYYISDFPPNYT